MLTIAIQGRDSTLQTVVSVSKAAYDCLQELCANLDAVFESDIKLAEDNDMDSELPDRRIHKVLRRLGEGNNQVTLSATDELKRELTEIIDVALSELKARFFKCGQLYALIGALMNTDTECQDHLHSYTEALYPEVVDADVAVFQFHVVRHILARISASTLQQ